MSYAVSLNCIISGEDTIIDGRNYNPSNPGLIFANIVDESKISYLKFANFHTTILCVKSITKMSVSHCQFFSNEIEYGYGMIFSSHGSLKIRDCIFSDNFFNGANCIETYTSQLYVKKSFFNDNIIESPINNLIYSANTIIEFNNLTFNRITSPTSLFRFEYRTYLTIVNVIFIQNIATEIINCDGVCNSVLNYVNFQQNTGILFKATSVSPILVLKWCQIESNSVLNNSPLFDMMNGRFFVIKPCRIIRNYAYCFIDFHNTYSQLSLSNSVFEHNSMSSHFVYISNLTTVKVFGVIFSQNSMPNGIFIGDNVYIKIHITTFKKNTGQPIYCKNCYSSIYLASFMDCSEPALVLTGKNSRRSHISSSQFLTTAPNNQNVLYINSSMCSMQFVRFSESKEKAISPGVTYFMCEFNQEGKGMYLKETFFISGSCIFIIIIIVITDCFGLIKSWFC